MRTISWLHVSDWHQRGSDFDRRVVRDALCADIRRRVEIDARLKRLDFVIFSGDLAFSGLGGEYERALDELLRPLLDAAGVSPESLFCVPGNHDIDRVTVREMLPASLQAPLISDDAINKWLTDDTRRRRLLEPFDAYRQCISKYSAQESPDYASVKTFQVGDTSVCLVGLNSALMCGRNIDSLGEPNDYGQLAIGEPQLKDAIDRTSESTLRIAVVHHPFEWLAPFDRHRAEHQIAQHFHFLLRGHEHRPQVLTVAGTTGAIALVPAGASYDRRIPDSPVYNNAYNFVCIDVDRGVGNVFVRRWSEARTAWIEDTDTAALGRYAISPLPKALVRPIRMLSERSLIAEGDIPVNAPRAAAEQRYRELLLEACDIINLTNLPDQDREIVQRQQELRLRSLYIPLRVHIEAPATARTAAATDDHILISMEERRAAAARGLSRTRGGVPRESRLRISVGERLKEAKRLIVLGDPGAGKTTLTRWIATVYLLRLKNDQAWRDVPDVQTLPDAEWLPVVIRCRDLDADAVRGSLDDILRHTLRKSELGDSDALEVAALIRSRIAEGRALLILDGLDEISEPQTRATFCQQLEKIVVAFPTLPIIATSRIVGYREMGYRLGRGFEHLTLADLTPKEKDEFIRRWCGLTEPPETRVEAINRLVTDLHSVDRIEQLTSNPMLLTTMALVRRNLGQLPKRRADLYWHAVQVLLNWRREVDEPLDWREAGPQLEYLAYAMCDRGVQQLLHDEVIELFSRMREEFPNVYAARNHTPEEFLRRLEARTGILMQAGLGQQVGMVMPVYEFRHLTFQEYLAARALVDGRFPRRDSNKSLAQNIAPLASRMTETDALPGRPSEPVVSENWREALRLCLGFCRDDDVDEVLDAVLGVEGQDSGPSARARAVLAASCLADEPNASDAVAIKVVEQLARHVGDFDHSYSGSALWMAIKEMASTRWRSLLLTALLKEHQERHPTLRWPLGSIIASVRMLLTPLDSTGREETIRSVLDDIRHGDELKAAGAALLAMDWAFTEASDPQASTANGDSSALRASVADLASVAAMEAMTRVRLVSPYLPACCVLVTRRRRGRLPRQVAHCAAARPIIASTSCSSVVNKVRSTECVRLSRFAC